MQAVVRPSIPQESLLPGVRPEQSEEQIYEKIFDQLSGLLLEEAVQVSVCM